MTTSSHPNICRSRAGGFTLVEILTVVAIIALLIAILVPAVGGVQRSAVKSRTRSQFSQYILAYEAFRADAGYYPTMNAGSAEFGLKGSNDVFVETLSGSDAAGGAPSSTYARTVNPRRIPYYSFAESEFAPEDTEFAGEIVDGFDNPNIYIVIDQDLNGIVPVSDFKNLDPAEQPSNDLRGGVFVYSANNDNDPDWEWVKSWE